MKRLTTDAPQGNFETTLNYVYGKDGWAHIRSDGEQEDVPLHEWAKKQCQLRGCYELSDTTPEGLDETICDCAFDSPGCPVYLAYVFASQAVHMRSRLKQYEDTGLEPKEAKKIYGLLAEVAEDRNCHFDFVTQCVLEVGKRIINAPLTLEELREMDGEPVWVDFPRCSEASGWMLISVARNCVYDGLLGYCDFDNCCKTWLAYRRKPEEGTI